MKCNRVNALLFVRVCCSVRAHSVEGICWICDYRSSVDTGVNHWKADNVLSLFSCFMVDGLQKDFYIRRV